MGSVTALAVCVMLALEGCSPATPTPSPVGGAPTAVSSPGTAGGSAAASTPVTPQASPRATSEATWNWRDSCLLSVAEMDRLLQPMGGPHLVRVEQGYPTPEQCTYAANEEPGDYTIEVTVRPRFYSTSQHYDTGYEPQGWYAPDPASGFKQSCASMKRRENVGNQLSACWGGIGKGAAGIGRPGQSQVNVFLDKPYFFHVELSVSRGPSDRAGALQVGKSIAEAIVGK